MQYRREIDGLRAIAVLPVILFHAGFSVFSGGYVGVDVFFVISGYLITSILISELEQGKFSIARFYERRARRILPALFVVMLACLPFAYMWMLPTQLKDFAQSLVAVVFFGSNILFWRESGYFGADAELKPLLHTWSLAVEEQYYLLFPVFLLLAWRFGRNKVFWSVVVIAAISLLLAEWGWRNKPSANFYLAPTRAWELLAGSICAFLTVGRTLKSNNMLSAIGLAAIIFAIFGFGESTPFPSVYALVPVVGTALIILFGRQGTWVAKLLSMRAFVGIGLISYSAYLWHQPLFAFARLHSLTEPSHVLMGALAIAALLLAWGTWRWVEQPFRKRANPVLITRRSVFVVSGTVGAVFLALGLAGHFLSEQLREVWIRSHPEFAAAYSALENAELHSNFGVVGEELQQLGACRFNLSNLSDEVEAELLACSDANGSGILILGDSHAIDVFGLVASRFDNPFLVGITQGSCRPHTYKNFCQYEKVLQFVNQYPSVFQHIIYSQAGFYLLLDASGNKGSRTMFSDQSINAEIVGLKVDTEHVAATYSYLRELSKHTNVSWFGPRIETHISKNMVLRMGCDGEFTLRPGQAEVFSELDEYLRDVTDEGGFVEYISQIEMLEFDAAKDFMSCPDLYFSDGDHYSAAGEVLFGGRLTEDLLIEK